MIIKTTNDYIIEKYGTKMYKLSLDGGFSCPNRENGTGGCRFCSAGGSGDFAGSINNQVWDNDLQPYPLHADGLRKRASSYQRVRNKNSHTITEQIKYQKKLLENKTRGKEIGYIAYFQAFTGTYGDVNALRKLYCEAISDPEVRILSIATRPDCLPADVLELLKDLSGQIPVWIELGLQTSNEDTAAFINRGYPLSVYDEAMKNLKAIGISHIITHMIACLPGESLEDMKKTISHIIDSGSDGIKIQLLQILKATGFEQDYYNGNIWLPTMEEYGNILMELLKILPENMVVHRITGDGPKNLLIAPQWCKDKKKVMNYLNKLIRETNV